MNRNNATTALVALLVLANAFTVVKVLGTAASANRTAQALVASQRSQLANRAGNVKTWCGAINQGRNYARYLRKTTHQAPYRLADLDCPALEMQTVQSAKPK